MYTYIHNVNLYMCTLKKKSARYSTDKEGLFSKKNFNPEHAAMVSHMQAP